MLCNLLSNSSQALVVKVVSQVVVVVVLNRGLLASIETQALSCTRLPVDSSPLKHVYKTNWLATRHSMWFAHFATGATPCLLQCWLFAACPQRCGVARALWKSMKACPVMTHSVKTPLVKTCSGSLRFCVLRQTCRAHLPFSCKSAARCTRTSVENVIKVV